MIVKNYAVKLDEKQIEVLEKISKENKVFLEELMHQAVDVFYESSRI